MTQLKIETATFKSAHETLSMSDLSEVYRPEARRAPTEHFIFEAWGGVDSRDASYRYTIRLVEG
eukprot:5370794-Prymnesium_polylepis.1